MSQKFQTFIDVFHTPCKAKYDGMWYPNFLDIEYYISYCFLIKTIDVHIECSHWSFPGQIQCLHKLNIEKGQAQIKNFSNLGNLFLRHLKGKVVTSSPFQKHFLCMCACMVDQKQNNAHTL